MSKKLISFYDPPGDGTVLASGRILVVEDDDTIRLLNARVLVCSGYVVEAAEDGLAAWDALQANNFDLLITDHNMPRLTGLELVKKVRLAHMPLPIILASASALTEELAQQPWLQLSATLQKPYTPHQLLATVQAAMRVRT